VVASDKLFFWLFQDRTERLQPLVASLLADMDGYSFTAPVIKEREVCPDGLFLPPVDELHDKPALIMEAQMAAHPEFFLRLDNNSSLLLMHQYRQGQPLRHWRMVVFCPSREMNFGDPVPVAEFLPNQQPTQLVAARLAEACGHPSHAFWPQQINSVSALFKRYDNVPAHAGDSGKGTAPRSAKQWLEPIGALPLPTADV